MPRPEVLEYVDESITIGDPDVVGFGLGGEGVDLVTVSVHQGHPGALVLGVTPLGLGEQLGDDHHRVVDPTSPGDEAHSGGRERHGFLVLAELAGISGDDPLHAGVRGSEVEEPVGRRGVARHSR